MLQGTIILGGFGRGLSGEEYTYQESKAILEQTGSQIIQNKNITQNGTYVAADENALGYSSVTVDISDGGSGGTYIEGTLYPPTTDIGENCDYYVNTEKNIVFTKWNNQWFELGVYDYSILSAFTYPESDNRKYTILHNPGDYVRAGADERRITLNTTENPLLVVALTRNMFITFTAIRPLVNGSGVNNGDITLGSYAYIGKGYSSDRVEKIALVEDTTDTTEIIKECNIPANNYAMMGAGATGQICVYKPSENLNYNLTELANSKNGSTWYISDLEAYSAIEFFSSYWKENSE